MHHYLIVETQSALASKRLSGISLALEAAEDGSQVSLWLMQDGTQALQSAQDVGLEACCAHANIRVFADAFALNQRGISLAGWPQVESAGIDVFATRLLSTDTRPIWH